MPDRKVLEGLLDIKIENILRLFFQNEDELFHINKISAESKVPLATSFRIVRKLVGLKIIKTVEIGKFKVYKLDAGKKTKLLMQLIK